MEGGYVGKVLVGGSTCGAVGTCSGRCRTWLASSHNNYFDFILYHCLPTELMEQPIYLIDNIQDYKKDLRWMCYNVVVCVCVQERCLQCLVGSNRQTDLLHHWGWDGAAVLDGGEWWGEVGRVRRLHHLLVPVHHVQVAVELLPDLLGELKTQDTHLFEMLPSLFVSVTHMHHRHALWQNGSALMAGNTTGNSTDYN